MPRDRFGATSPLAAESECARKEYFKGTLADDCERCCNVEDCECDRPTDVTRRFLRAHSECTPYVVRKPHEMLPFGGTLELVFTNKDFQACANAENTPTWMAWQNCIEVSTFTCTSELKALLEANPSVLKSLLQLLYQPPGPLQDVKFLKDTVAPFAMDVNNLTSLEDLFRAVEEEGMAVLFEVCKLMYTGYFESKEGRVTPPALHSQVHVKMGYGSDLMDVTTSPNEAALFFAYHSDIDRSNMHWMVGFQSTPLFKTEGARYSYPTSVEPFEFVGKPPFGTSGPFSVYDFLVCGADPATYTEFNISEPIPWLRGSTLNEVTTSAYPFFDLFECDADKDCSGRPNGYTHQDILYWSSPERTPYTYDSLAYLYGPKKKADFHRG
eukprot:g71514.t1